MPKDTQGMVLLILLAPLLRSGGVICITKSMPVCIIENFVILYLILDYPMLFVLIENIAF